MQRLILIDEKILFLLGFIERLGDGECRRRRLLQGVQSDHGHQQHWGLQVTTSDKRVMTTYQ